MILNTLSVSSADCERGFSTMNVVCSDLRNALTVQHISNLMLMSLVGPPVSKFKPKLYVERWLLSHRHADYKKREPEMKRDGVHQERFQMFWGLFCMAVFIVGFVK